MKIKPLIKLFFVAIVTFNMTLLVGNNNKFSLAQNKQKNIDYQAKTICPPNDKACYEKASNQIHCNPRMCCPPKGSCYERTRGVNKITILMPINREFLDTNKPTFVWHEDEQKNQTYKITLKRIGDNIPLWQTETTETTITYTKQLTEGLYTFTVERNNMKTKIHFNIPSDKDMEEIQKEIQAIKTKYPNPTLNIEQESQKTIEIAKFYYQEELITQAIQTLEEAIKNNTKTPQIYLELGSINRDLRNWKQAINYLKEADKISQNTNEFFWSAQAEQFIAEIYSCGRNDKIKSIEWYQKAKETYQQLGKTEYVEAIENKIKQLKDSDEINTNLCHSDLSS